MRRDRVHLTTMRQFRVKTWFPWSRAGRTVLILESRRMSVSTLFMLHIVNVSPQTAGRNERKRE